MHADPDEAAEATRLYYLIASDIEERKERYERALEWARRLLSAKEPLTAFGRAVKSYVELDPVRPSAEEAKRILVLTWLMTERRAKIAGRSSAGAWPKALCGFGGGLRGWHAMAERALGVLRVDVGGIGRKPDRPQKNGPPVPTANEKRLCQAYHDKPRGMKRNTFAGNNGMTDQQLKYTLQKVQAYIRQRQSK